MVVWSYAGFGVLIILIVSILGLYITYTRLLIKLAKKLGIKNNLWFLYVPFLQNYVIYQMAGFSIITFILSIASPFFYLFYILFLSVFTSEFYSNVFLLLFGVSIFPMYIIPVIWFWKLAKKLGYSGWWSLVFPLWVCILEWETDSEENKKKEQLKIDYAKIHKEEINKKEDNEFMGFLKGLGILFVIIVLFLIIKAIFF
ncbi:MAG: hypothetical protein Q7R52_03585 [archaeon]|nr:hypothetical protein [archaeon]